MNSTDRRSIHFYNPARNIISTAQRRSINFYNLHKNSQFYNLQDIYRSATEVNINQYKEANYKTSTTYIRIFNLRRVFA